LGLKRFLRLLQRRISYDALRDQHTQDGRAERRFHFVCI